MEGGRKWTQHLAALAACLSALSVGTTMSWTSAASIPLQDKNNDFHVSVNEFSWVSAILAIGAMLGAVPLGILANTVGRKKLVLILAPFMIVGYLLLVWASELWMLLLGRFINGIITGAYCVIPSMYTSEIAEDSIRGVLGSYFQLLITMGILFNYVLDALELSLTGVSIACACVPAVLFIVLLFFPDTPRWYLSKGRREEAQKSLQYFRGLENVDKELESIQSSIDMQRAEKLPLTKAFSTTAAKKGLFLALFVMIFQQFSGINAVIFYSSDIFRDANVGLEPKVSTVIVGVFQVLATYISTLLVDRLGRRPLLLMSGALMAISGGLLGVYFYLDQKTSVTEDVDISWLPIVCMIVFIVFFSLGMGPIPWLYMGEVFSDQIKESAMSVATVTNWLSVFVVTKFYGDLSESIGNYSTFWIFSGISIIGCFFTTFCLVETKGKDFTAILSELGGGNVSSLRNGTAHPQEERI